MSVLAMGYAVIETPDGAAWDRFLTDVVGAMRAPAGVSGAARYRLDGRIARFVIRQGGEERLLAAGYAVDGDAALDALSASILAAGRPVSQGDEEEARDRGVGRFFRTSDPAGNGLEFYIGDAHADTPFVSPAGVGGFVTGEQGLGHAVFAAPDFEASHAFYRDVIGLGDTDLPRLYLRGGEDDPGLGVAFMHAAGGRHHSVAIIENPPIPSGCIHLMVEMETLTEVGRCHDRMRHAGVAESASIGRHTNDQTVGFYMKTPADFDLEVGCDSLVIDPKSWIATAHANPSEWGHDWAWQRAMRATTAETAR